MKVTLQLVRFFNCCLRRHYAVLPGFEYFAAAKVQSRPPRENLHLPKVNAGFPPIV